MVAIKRYQRKKDGGESLYQYDYTQVRFFVREAVRNEIIAVARSLDKSTSAYIRDLVERDLKRRRKRP